MRVLFLTPQLPYPPHQGAALRNFNLIKNLAGRHEIYLLSFGDPQADTGELGRYCAAVHIVPPPRRSTMQRALAVGFSPRADMELRLRSAAFRDRLQLLRRQGEFAIMQVEGIEMAQYLLAGGVDGGALVFDDHNAEYVLQRRAWENDRRNPRKWVGALYSLVQWQKLVRYERSICRRASAVVAVSDADSRALRDLDPRLNVTVVANGIDPEYFRPDPRRSQAACGRRLVFTGTLDFRPNVDAVTWFCREVLPGIQAQEPQVELYVVGQRPHPAVRALAGARVFVTGAVPDVRPYMAQSAVYVVPLRVGGGTRFKVLEAMASGVPVVSTTLGAEGIEATDGADLVLADHPAEFAARVVELLRSPERAEGLAAQARRHVNDRYDWRVLVPRLDDLYATVVARRPAGW